MKPILLVILMLVTSSALAQSNGLILDDEAYKQAILADTITDSTRGGGLPDEVDLRRYCPIAGDQGDLPSCVAWSLANALTIHQAKKQGITNQEAIHQIRFSVAYIYNQINYKGLCDMGATMTSGLNLLKEKGDCPAYALPYTEQCIPKPNSQHNKKAEKYKIKGKRKLFSQSASVDTKINRILDELSVGHPVVIAMNVPYNFRSYIPAPYTPWPGDEPHAMLVVGYNDQYNFFTVMNSYGPHWGDDGFFHLDWNTLGQQVIYGYVLIL